MIEFIKEIEETFFYSPYIGISVDLIQAVAEEYAFSYKVTQTTGWKSPNDHIKSVVQYDRFIELILNTETPSVAPVPNIRIGLYN